MYIGGRVDGQSPPQDVGIPIKNSRVGIISHKKTLKYNLQQKKQHIKFSLVNFEKFLLASIITSCKNKFEFHTPI